MSTSDNLTARPEKNGANAAEASRASGSLREQYFACVASGRDNCQIPSQTSVSLEMTSPYGGASIVEVPHPITSNIVLPRAKWTMAVNLTTTLDHGRSEDSGDDDRVYAGARSKTAQLLDLARDTKDQSVNLVVQNAEPINERSTKMRLHTYLIHDGKIDELPERPSGGVAADTQALLEIAGKQAPSDRIGLISQSHGGGPHGISGDTGRADLKQLKAAITKGLVGSGHERLDVLDFDACSMGNSRVLESFSRLAQQIIAAPESEGASGSHVDGQNERELISRLIRNADMTGSDFGHMAIDLANRGFNGGEAAVSIEDKKPGTPSLSQYDSSKVDAFTASVEHLGEALSQAWMTPFNREAIQKAIEDSPFSTKPGMHLANSPTPEERDASDFANNILKAVSDHRLADPDDKIKNSAQALLNARAEMVIAYHGEREGGYDRQGGVSLFLPGRGFFDNSDRTASQDEGLRLGDIATRKKSSGFANRDEIVEDIEFSISGARRHLNEGHNPDQVNPHLPSEAADFAPLEESQKAIASAQTEAQFKASIKAFSERARTFENTPSGRALTSQASEEVTAITRSVLDAEMAPSTPAFNRFLNELYAYSIY